jgi:DNA polymerase-3 subunit epsilon
MRQIVLDTETTGLSHADGHRIIEIGCVELVQRQITNNNYHQYINPERPVDEGAYAVHGIGDDFLAQQPLFASIAEQFIEYVRGAELIIHNAPFDVGFLDAELSRLMGKTIKVDDLCTVTDTLVLARRKHPGQRNSLDALCKRYHVDRSHREYHGALLDAELLARVYLLLTGGQGNLFEIETASQAVQQQAMAQSIGQTASSGVVQPANQEEQAAHDAWLALLKDKAGQHYFAESSAGD